MHSLHQAPCLFVCAVVPQSLLCTMSVALSRNNVNIALSDTSGSSIIKIRNRRGTGVEPCGTHLDATGGGLGVASFCALYPVLEVICEEIISFVA